MDKFDIVCYLTDENDLKPSQLMMKSKIFEQKNSWEKKIRKLKKSVEMK